MPLGSPSIVGPLTPCCERVRVLGQFSGSRVRVFVDGDPNPVGDLTVPWSDFESRWTIRVWLSERNCLPAKNSAAQSVRSRQPLRSALSRSSSRPTYAVEACF
jgi:hypothetical protein